jgi:hypothetical protein
VSTSRVSRSPARPVQSLSSCCASQRRRRAGHPPNRRHRREAPEAGSPRTDQRLF